ncbi:hypothetical protein BVG81_005870 [Haliangium sp. UPWRP_2]|nr:redoxin domain-containing protein [Haliangium sp. UPWRP_2]PSM31347.1 hypothetical protein BVG81_005870 [Haliangium sp. UPWRP_2]
MAEYRDRDFTALGVQLVALSVDDPTRAEAMRAQLKLPFPVLCDCERKVITEWGLLNAKEKGGIAYPAVFVLDRDRTVRFLSQDRTAARVSPDALLAFLQSGMPRMAAAPKQETILPGLSTFFSAFKNALAHGVRVPKK